MGPPPLRRRTPRRDSVQLILQLSGSVHLRLALARIKCPAGACYCTFLTSPAIKSNEIKLKRPPDVRQDVRNFPGKITKE